MLPRRPEAGPRSARRLVLAIIALGAVAVTSRQVDGQEKGFLLKIPAPSPNSEFGASVSPAGDFDGDAVGDVLVGAPAQAPGKVYIMSGADASVLRTFDGEGYGNGFGMACALVGDLDGRGKSDFLVGAPLGGTAIPEVSHRTYAKVFAGEDGTVLFDSGDMPSDSRFGASVAVLGDIDGDGLPDFAVGRPEQIDVASSPPGSVYVYSGGTGALLKVLHGSENGDGFGTTLASVGDIDGDGVPDFAVGSPGASRGSRPLAGYITVYSGSTFEALRIFKGRSPFESLGASFAAVAPVGATHGRISFPASGGPGRRGGIATYDLKTGRCLLFLPRLDRSGFGTRLSEVGDVDGDGVPDLAATSSSLQGLADGTPVELVEVFSGARGGLLFSYRGTPGLLSRMSISGTTDVDGDGDDELLVGLPGEDAAIVFRLAPDVIPANVRVALQRPPGGTDPDARGTLVAGPHVGLQPMQMTADHLDFPGGWPNVFLEEGAGSNSFVQVGFLRPQAKEGTWVLDVATNGWTPPDTIRYATLGDLAGSRIEVRGPTDEVLLQAVLPTPGGQKFSGSSALQSPGPAGPPGARGTVRVNSSARTGTLRVSVSTEGLSKTANLDVWLEDGPSAGAFTAVGTLSRGCLVIDSGRGDPFPGIAPDGSALSGRLIEVRDGATTLLQASLP